MTGSIPQSFIDELIAKSDLIDIIGARVTLKKTGSNYSALCPFHNEKTPSFSVNATKQFFHCFGCGKNGNVISFLMAYDHLDFVAAIEYLAEKANLTVPQQKNAAHNAEFSALTTLMNDVTNFYQEQLKAPGEAAQAITYLKQRGLSGQIAKQFQLGYANSRWDSLVKRFGKTQQQLKQLLQLGLVLPNKRGGYYDRFRERVLFPIRNQRGLVIGFGGRVLKSDQTPKYLNSPETPLFHKGQELYGFYEASKATNADTKQVVIVEGYMDVLALVQHGFYQVVATLGTSTTREHLQRLFRRYHTITFCFDGDRAGKQAAWRALTVALPILRDDKNIQFMFLPDDEDPDSLVRKVGLDGFNAQLNAALSLEGFFFDYLTKHNTLASLADKAKLKEQALALIATLPTGLYKNGLMSGLAQHLQITPESLAQLAVEKIPVPAHANPQPASQSTSTKFLSPIRLAIALLLQNPELVAAASDYKTTIETSAAPGCALLNKLITLINQQPSLTTGALVEHWRGDEDYAVISKLAVYEHFVPVSGAREEFVGALQRLQDRVLERKIESLMIKASEGSLSTEEKTLLNALLRQRNMKEKLS